MQKFLNSQSKDSRERGCHSNGTVTVADGFAEGRTKDKKNEGKQNIMSWGKMKDDKFSLWPFDLCLFQTSPFRFYRMTKWHGISLLKTEHFLISWMMQKKMETDSGVWLFRMVHFWFCIYDKENLIFSKSHFFAIVFSDVLCHLLYTFFLQITELLDDERCEAECEELPQDGEEAPKSPDSPQHTETDGSPATR